MKRMDSTRMKTATISIGVSARFWSAISRRRAEPRAMARASRCAVVVMAVWLALVATASSALYIDYMREERWAREVGPSLVVGDAVYLATPARSKVLAILTTPGATSKGAI